MTKQSILLVAALAACVDSKTNNVADTSAPRTAPVVTSVRVNQATAGMTSRVKWMLSSDSSAIIALVDPTGVENEAIPNGFFYGSESQNFQARMDSVWDVAPSPDWKTIAFSRAYVLNPRELDSIPPSMWQDVARKTGMDTATVRTGSFASSGMSMARAIAQPGTIKVPADARTLNASDDAAPHFYPVALGWRVRWTTDGNFIALGNSPATVQDDAPSETWASLDPKTGAFHSTLPGDAKTIAPKWIDGPKLELSVPVDIQGAPALGVTAGGRHLTIESVRGVITAREIGAQNDSSSRTYTIGSGKALATTRSGRFILALAPRANAVANEMPVEAVVYVVGW
jgi:hypothetical protein